MAAPPPRHDPENIVGHVVGGRYLVRRCISQGGMGVIYLARQESLDRDVVLKVVRHDRADQEGVGRFHREARSLSMLSHPGVVQIFDHGFDEGTGLYFIAMEYIRGLTLSRYRKRCGALPLDEFLAIATQMLEGVAEVHRHGLLHRDLKPSNVMLTSPDGTRLRVKLLDFGLSKFAVSTEQLTQANSFLGSVHYLAPEVIRGQSADTRADVYALGVTFFQLLSGSNPIEGTDPYHVLLQQVGGGARPLASALPRRQQLPSALLELVDRCLSPQTHQRPHDARVLLEELSSSLARVTPRPDAVVAAIIAHTSSEPTQEPPPSRPPASTPPPSAAPASRAFQLALWSLLGMSGLLLLVVAVVLGLLLVGIASLPS
jgi:serine/threonine protein kinase